MTPSPRNVVEELLALWLMVGLTCLVKLVTVAYFTLLWRPQEEPVSEEVIEGRKGAVVGGLVGGAALPAAVTSTVTAVGFTSTGITSGSYAASMMSASAIASGGGVPAGGLVATLQSIGAVGLGAVAFSGLAVIGAGAGALSIYSMARKKIRFTMVRDCTTRCRSAHSMEIGNLNMAFEYLKEHRDVCGFTFAGNTARFYHACADDLLQHAVPVVEAVLFLKRYV